MAINNSKTAYLFDVDGVLTNPKAKTVSPEIIEALVDLLRHQHPIALNTGRSISWLLEPVIAPLITSLTDHKLLDNLLIVGEKGACWIHGKNLPSHSSNLAEVTIEIDPNVSVSLKLQNDIRSLIEQKYADAMFYDHSKLTMVTAEMKDGEDLENFELRQEALIKDLSALLVGHQANNLKIDPTRIATDIENNHVGKALGARRILELMQTDNLNISQFEYLCFGDSRSDLEIARELHQQGLSVRFVFVGKPEQFSQEERHSLPFTFIQTVALFDNGTLEFLRSTS